MKFAAVSVALVLYASLALAEVPSEVMQIVEKVKSCISEGKTEKEQCARQFIKDILPLASAPGGIPELKVPSLNPLVIKLFTLPKKTSLVEGDFRVFDVKISGLTNFELKGVTLDMDKKSATINASFPLISMDGEYFVDGNVMVMPIQGNDTFWMKLSDVELTATGTASKKDDHLKLEERAFDFTFKNGSIHLNNLLGGDEVGVAVNNILNSNFLTLYADLKPFVMGILHEIGDGIIVGPLESLPASLLDL